MNNHQNYKKDLKLGIALGSGGRLGISHVGVLKVLEKNNIKINYITGCSMGAVIGGLYALNPHIKQLEKTLLSLTRKDLIRLIDPSLTKNSLIKGEKIKNFLENLIGDKTFSDVKIPFKVTATNLETGDSIVIEHGKLINGIMASISIPGLFPPVKIDGQILVDGGITNPTPINLLKEMGADLIIGVDLTMKDEVELKDPNIFQILLRSYDILRTQVAKNNIYRENEKLLLIRPDISKLEKFKYYEIRKFIHEGEKAAKEALLKIKTLLSK